MPSVGEAGKSWLVPSICYEAGPYGYGIQRQLSEAGHECVVVAPSLVGKTAAGFALHSSRTDAAVDY
jgi:transposase